MTLTDSFATAEETPRGPAAAEPTVRSYLEQATDAEVKSQVETAASEDIVEAAEQSEESNEATAS